MRYLKIILILFSLKTFGQSGKTLVPGHMCRIPTLTIDKKTKDSIPFVLVEGFIKDERILYGISNIDGEENFQICSNKLSIDTVTFKITAVGYIQDTFKFKLYQDSTLVFTLTADPSKAMTEKKMLEYQNTFFMQCGTDQVNRLYLENPTYRNCDGRILTYKQISANNEDLNQWDLIDAK
jgi:hypothetical protein